MMGWGYGMGPYGGHGGYGYDQGQGQLELNIEILEPAAFMGPVEFLIVFTETGPVNDVCPLGPILTG